MIFPALVALSLAGAAAHGTFHRNSRVFGSVMGRLPTRDRVIALTFDDGPNPDATPRILDTLGQYGIRATFFVLGAHAERWPELVHRIASEGHQVGNHGYFHRKLHLKPPSYVERDIALGTTAIERSGAASPRFFRPPHGFRSPWVSRIAASYGQQTVGWSLGVWDSDLPGVKKIVKRTVEGVRPGSIVLLHDGDGYDPYGDRLQTAKALPRIISELRDRDYAFARLPS
jgi:peptidoglycan/xylan/chitin deacetylase (PgdA/CDA1 family)